MTIQPRAELLFDPHDLSEKARLQVIESTQDTSVRGSLSRALFAQHVFVITEARRRVAESAQVTPELMVAVMDYVWQAFTPKFVRISGPQIALVYGRALQAAHAGEVDSRYIESLAAEHARRLSTYFHETSRDAVMEAFNTYVNRKVPLRAAAEKALSGYGLTSRQIRGYAANTALEAKVNSSVFRRAEAKAMDYVSKSLVSRVTKFAKQEEHNLDQQAEQIAWMWMVEHGRLPENAEKIWLTAKDEMTCKVCAPMHGKVVKVSERFELPNRVLLWVPGVHPNCRCVVRFRVPRQMVIAKADFDPREHPRGGDPENRGRFSAANRRGPRFKEPDAAEDELREKVQEILQRESDTQEITLDREQTPAQEVSLTRPQEITLPGREPQQEIDLSSPQQIGLPRPAQEASLSDRLQDVAMRRQIQDIALAVADTLPRAPVKPGPIEHQGVIPLINEKTGRVMPVYRLINVDEEKLDKKGRIHFEHEQQWTSDAALIASQALKWRADEIADRTMALQEEPSAPHLQQLGDAYVQLNNRQCADLVKWVADQNIPAVASRTQDATMNVDIYWPNDDADDENWDSIQMTYKELADLFDIKPSQFAMDVAVVTTGHNSPLGRTDVRPGKHGTTVTLSGDFEVSTSHRGETILGAEKAPGLTFYHLNPADVVTEQF